MPKFATPDAYVAAQPPHAQKALNAARKAIKSAVPEAEERISYAIIGFFTPGWKLYLSAAKEHWALYGGVNEALAAIPGLRRYESSGKGTIRFPYDEPVPMALVKEMTRFGFARSGQYGGKVRTAAAPKTKAKAAAKPAKPSAPASSTKPKPRKAARAAKRAK